MATSSPRLGRLKLGRDSIDLDYYLTADYTNIEDAAAELPAVIEWVNSASQSFVEDMYQMEGEVEVAEAAAYFNLLRVTGDDNFATLFPDVKKTEAALKHAVALDAGVRTAKDSYAKARAQVERLRKLQSSLSSRLDLVRSSEATRRQIFPQHRDQD